MLRTINDIQLFFLIMFPFDFSYLIIIYINFKFSLNFIKHYIHVGKVKGVSYQQKSEVVISKGMT